MIDMDIKRLEKERDELFKELEEKKRGLDVLDREFSSRVCKLEEDVEVLGERLVKAKDSYILERCGHMIGKKILIKSVYPSSEYSIRYRFGIIKNVSSAYNIDSDDVKVQFLCRDVDVSDEETCEVFIPDDKAYLATDEMSIDMLLNGGDYVCDAIKKTVTVNDVDEKLLEVKKIVMESCERMFEIDNK